MRQRGLIGRCRRRWTKTTIPDPDLTDAAVDRLKRAFGPGTVELDRVYVGDITYIWTWEGWAYLATVIDLGSRRVVGWAIADHMRAELVCDALTMAIGARRPAAGAMFHSDRGTQYTSTAFTSLLADHEMIQSLSRPRQCWDNAVAESFFATTEERAHRLPLLGHRRPGPRRRVRVHRGLLQPATPPLPARLPHPSRVRIPQDPPPQGRQTRHSQAVRRTGSTPVPSHWRWGGPIRLAGDSARNPARRSSSGARKCAMRKSTTSVLK